MCDGQAGDRATESHYIALLFLTDYSHWNEVLIDVDKFPSYMSSKQTVKKST